MGTITASSTPVIEKPGRWLPYDHDVLKQWLEHMVQEVDDSPKPIMPAVQELQDLIDSDATIFMHVCSMFEQVPSGTIYDKDPLGRPQLRSYQHMLQVLSLVMTSAPKWNSFVHKVGWVGFPINVILNWPMSTASGKAFFLNPKVNACLKKILDGWAEYLGTPSSCNVLSTKDGWLSPDAMQALVTEATSKSSVAQKFEQIFECDSSLPYYGFKSWDDFFTRRFSQGVRPLAGPEDQRSCAVKSPYQDPQNIIVNACESRPYRLASHVARRDRFWVKDQPYSLVDMLANDSSANDFVGGTVYQAFLSGLSYHRWHSPVTGTVIKAYIVPGTYYSKAASQEFGSAHTSLSPSQAYLAEVATRAIILIQADNPEIGLMCFMPIGMAEVSTCEITVREGQQVSKGSELGLFHYGGSTYCMLFRCGIELDWTPEARMAPTCDGDSKKKAIIPVNSQIATIKITKTTQ